MDGDGALSFKVLVVPEDSTNNGYILKPLIEKMLAKCGKPAAEIKVLDDPHVNGYEHAKNVLRTEVFEKFRFMNLLMFLPDADGKDRTQELRALEEEASRQRARLLCCAARQEVEAWLLAGHRSRLDCSWQQIREDTSVKENVFAPFLATYGNPNAPGEGREILMAETLRKYKTLLQLCPELAELERRIRGVVVP